MKILVPVKRVPDPYAKVRDSADGSGIETAGLKYVINPFDEIAVEEAVRLKEKQGAEVVAVSIGGAECEEQLRAALAMGAERALLVKFQGTTDSRVIAHLLAAVYKQETPDMVLMGKQAIDDDSNQAGQMLAAIIGRPQATFTSQLTVGSGTARAVREVDAGQETLEVALPAVVTTDLRLNEPRYVALPGIIKARSKPLQTLEASALGVNVEARVKTLKLEPPAPRAAGRKVAGVDELLAALRNEAKVV